MEHLSHHCSQVVSRTGDIICMEIRTNDVWEETLFGSYFCTCPTETGLMLG